MFTGVKTPGGAGTHTGHTRDPGHAGAQRHTDHADEDLTTIQTHHAPTTHIPHVSETTEAEADSTATGPEPTAPRGLAKLSSPSEGVLSTCVDRGARSRPLRRRWSERGGTAKKLN